MSISEYNLMTRDSRKWTPMCGPFIRERRKSGPEKQQPKHNPCWPVSFNAKVDLVDLCNNACDWSNLTKWPWPLPGAREKSGTCLQCVWQRPIRSVETQTVFQLDPWFVLGGIAHHKHWPQKHVSYPQLTATSCRITICRNQKADINQKYTRNIIHIMAIMNILRGGRRGISNQNWCWPVHVRSIVYHNY